MPVSHRTSEMQSRIASATHGWMLHHGLSGRDLADAVAPLVGTFACRCSPDERDPAVADPQGYELAAKFLALFWALDDQAAQHQAGRDLLDQVQARLTAVPDGDRPAGGHPCAQAVSELLEGLTGPDRRDTGAFVASFADHVYAVEEEALARTTRDAAGAPDAPDLCAGIDELLRLRPLLIATEPYIRLWQTALGLWPGPSFVQTVASLWPEVRRAHPHAGLDHALEVARLAYARTPAHSARRAPALSELEALAVVLTYLANDLGSLERDRGGDGPAQEPNLVLLLERYFLARSLTGVRVCHWDEMTWPISAMEQAVTTAVSMYNTGVARLQALQRLVPAHEHDGSARRYLSLLANIVDGNLQGMLEHSGTHAQAPAGAASASETAPHGQATEPRYGSVANLARLRSVADAR